MSYNRHRSFLSCIDQFERQLRLEGLGDHLLEDISGELMRQSTVEADLGMARVRYSNL